MLLTIVLWLSRFFGPSSSGQITANSCELDQGYCSIKFEQGTLNVQFYPANIPLEEEIQIHLELPETMSFKSAWIEGINMYMGKIPFIVESQESNIIEGISYLGSCSEASMSWQLVIELTDNTSHSTQVFQLLFSTNY
ncbi:hypothetical protein QX776_03655 [Alteromonadaceae bacterium BrNp21-10]|nr:hypothetical protein [Alteromonadaceae bacterium BrNp21-10]